MYVVVYTEKKTNKQLWMIVYFTQTTSMAYEVQKIRKIFSNVQKKEEYRNLDKSS